MGAPMTEELMFDPENQQPADARLFHRRRQGGQRDRRGKEGIELEKRLAPPPPPATRRTGGVKLAAVRRAAASLGAYDAWNRVRAFARAFSPPLPHGGVGIRS